MHRWSLALVAVLAPLFAAAGGSFDAGDGLVRAVRTDAPIAVDGRLDEAAWETAPPFDAFVQSFPAEGDEPSERTEVRVLYDDRNLYVGILCRDSDAAEILRPMGRRDQTPYSDRVVVIINGDHNQRTAFAFSVSAAGVLEDGLYYEDDVYTKDWDAVWLGAAAERDDGWSAELAIPIGILGVSPSAPEAWGFAVRREIGRTHEVASSVLLPPLGRGVASRLGDLVGIEDLERRAQVQIAPYAASRVVLRPQYSDASRPRPRLLDFIGDVGVDLKAELTDRLVLDATVNPDFSQVEADEVIQNLTRFERSFPEKRPFFQQSLDLFQPAGSDANDIPHQLFYSRRIGLASPLLAAGKVSGTLSDAVHVNLLDAVVTGAGAGESTEDAPDRQYVFQPRQPLHFAPLDTYPAVAPASQNFFAGVARWRAAQTLGFGATLTSAVPLEAPCTADQAALSKSSRPARCGLLSGNAGGLDWDLRSGDSEWRIVGQLTGSQAEGGSPDRLVPDGTHIRRGDLGYGGYLRAGKWGGEPWRLVLSYDYASPKLDVNASGFQKTQNQQLLGAVLKYVTTDTLPFLYHVLYLKALTSFTTDGRAINRGNELAAGFAVQLRNFHTLSCDVGLDDPGYDVREISGSGVPYRRLPDTFVQCTYSTDPGRMLRFDMGAGANRTATAGPLPDGWDANLNAGVTFHPHARLETRLSVAAQRDRFQARYLDSDGQGNYTFADLASGYLSMMVRQQLVLSPGLTLQAYAQLFSQFGRYGPYYLGSSNGEAIRPEDLRPAPPPGWEPGFHSSTLIVNLVLRWEYRAGSTLFAVYARSQSELPPAAGGPPSASLLPGALGPGPTTDSVMLKWTHSWSF